MKFQEYLKPNQIMTEQLKWQNKQDIIAAARKRSKENYGETRDAVKQFVNDNPGCTAKQIASHLGRNNATFLAAYVRRGHLKSKKLDGKFRYFPTNYKFANEPEWTRVTLPATRLEPVHFANFGLNLPTAIEQKAKDFVWQKEATSIEVSTLKRFIEWVKDNE
jgi:hypothetical protein